MYAVIRTGGKQYKVESGQQLEVELLGAADDADVELTPVLVVDGTTVLATPSQLAGTVVTAKVVGETRGPKINAFTYKPKSNQRRHWGHRQHLSLVEITGITIGGATKPKSRAKAKAAAPAADETTTEAQEA